MSGAFGTVPLGLGVETFCPDHRPEVGLPSPPQLQRQRETSPVTHSRETQAVRWKEVRPVALLLWILAVVLVVSGILALIRRQFLWGIVLIVVGLIVGPGGVSIFV